MLSKQDVLDVLTVEQWARFNKVSMSTGRAISEQCWPEEELQRFLNGEVKDAGTTTKPEEVRPN